MRSMALIATMVCAPLLGQPFPDSYIETRLFLEQQRYFLAKMITEYHQAEIKDDEYWYVRGCYDQNEKILRSLECKAD